MEGSSTGRTNGRTLRVASVQMESVNDGDNIITNLNTARAAVQEAVDKGAEFVLLPEFASTGYSLTMSLWSKGETMEGPTVKFLKEMAKTHNIWIGSSFLQIIDTDYYNTFVLASPDGNIVGEVKKEVPATFERFFFKGSSNDHIINVPGLGKVGVLICYENFLVSTLKKIQLGNADLLLMPFCSPSIPSSIFFPKNERIEYNTIYSTLASRHAKRLGIPTIQTNHCGDFNSRMPFPFSPVYREEFLCGAVICDSNGNELVRAEKGTNVIVSEIELIEGKKKIKPVEAVYRNCRGYTFDPAPINVILRLFYINEWAGVVYYGLMGLSRRQAASIVTRQGSGVSGGVALTVTSGILLASAYTLAKQMQLIK